MSTSISGANDPIRRPSRCPEYPSEEQAAQELARDVARLVQLGLVRLERDGVDELRVADAHA